MRNKKLVLHYHSSKQECLGNENSVSSSNHAKGLGDARCWSVVGVVERKETVTD